MFRFFSKTRGMVLGIGFLGIGLAVAVYGMILTINLRKPAVDLNKVSWTTLKANQHVTIDLDFVMDEYMVYGEKDKNHEVKNVTSRFYTVPEITADENGGLNMTHFMGVAVPAKEAATYERIADKSYAWWTDTTGTVAWDPESVYIDGYLRKMSSDDKKYMREYLYDIGYSSEEVDEMLVPYVIMNNASSMVGLVAAGLVMAALGAAFLVMAIVGGALMPPMQGAIIDLGTVAGWPAVNASFCLPLICFIIVAIYGYRSLKLRTA